MFVFQASALGPHLHRVQGRGVINEDREAAHPSRRFNEACVLLWCDASQAQLLRADAGLHRDHALGDLLRCFHEQLGQVLLLSCTVVSRVKPA